jgi:HK97 family phage major capsid protein
MAFSTANVDSNFPTRGEVEVPQELSNEVLQDIPASSVAMQLSTVRRMSSRTYRQPVLDALPEAFWLSQTSTNHDAALKQTTKMDWSHFTMEVAEIAVIVPLPDSLVDDENIPLWAEIRPRVASAFAKKIDEAVLYGTDRPSVWTTDAIVPGAIAAGNTTTAHDPSTPGNGDTAADLAKVGLQLAEQGYDLSAFVTGPGYQYKLFQERDANGQPIYGPAQGTNPATIFGQPFLQVKSGVWDASAAEVITGDFSRSIIGLRQDITYTMHTDGVISDSDGKVLLNLMQQDAKAMRAVMRLAHVVVNDEVRQLSGHDHYPFAVLAPYVAPSS